MGASSKTATPYEIIPWEAAMSRLQRDHRRDFSRMLLMTGIATAQRYIARPSPLYLKRTHTNGISICTNCPLKEGELIVPVFVLTKSKVLSETALIDRRKNTPARRRRNGNDPPIFVKMTMGESHLWNQRMTHFTLTQTLSWQGQVKKSRPNYTGSEINYAPLLARQTGHPRGKH